ncbi:MULTISPECIES: DEAD/DEAH box helicase [unclassified Lacticaseibacillus]|uniref:DEAD/DEAH box helicase n=1 Tax=unclassified Lacticaseibacillus TaxID=2759744 RepID=UPI001943B719|nr:MULTISPECIES: DEAD/DEAH box helicase [unclassified Lacticaseibacillus]
MTNQFKQYQLAPFLLKALDAEHINAPTPIQEKVIPALLRGESVVGQSQTGSGKTHAFLLPLLTRIDLTQDEVQLVITAPSRELADQLYEVATDLAQFEPQLRIQRYVGGTDKSRQEDKLESKQPHVAIGTPGRLLDLISDHALTAYTAKMFVVDEADMTLDMGFLTTVDQIAGQFGEDLQMAVFSATIPQKLQPFLKKYMANPTVIELKPKTVIADTVQNDLIQVPARDRNALIYKLATMGEPFLVLIFANTKTHVDALHQYLTDQGLKVAKIHGDVEPRRRRQVMKQIGELKYQYVVATDLASRGIDIDGVSLVINAELPKDNEFFIHRVGRTGRNGQPGTAVTLYEPGQEAQIAELEHMGVHFTPKALKNGELVDTYDRNRRIRRQKKAAPVSGKIAGMAAKEAKKKMPGYKKKIRKAAEKEAWFNNRVEKRNSARSARKAKKERN